MKNFFYILLYTVLIFFITDFFFGKTILDNLYENGIILSDDKRKAKLERIQKQEKKYRIKNKIYHHTLKQNIKTQSIWGGNKYLTCTDKFGFRNFCDKIDNQNKNIILIGDSFTEGIGLEYKKTFSGMFAKKMDLRVMNMGVSSYSPVIYKNKIKYYLDNYNFKINHVIVFLDMSDIIDEAFYYIECDKVVCDRIVKKNTPISNFKKEKTIFPILEFIKVSVKNIKRKIKPKVYIYRKDFTRSNWTFVKETKEIKIGIQNSVLHMNELYKYLDKKNISLTIAVYPYPGQLLYDQENSKQVKIWKDFCKNKCKYFINYFPSFFGEIKNSNNKRIIDKYYIKNDVHFNFDGNKKIFEKLNNLKFQ